MEMTAGDVEYHAEPNPRETSRARWASTCSSAGRSTTAGTTRTIERLTFDPARSLVGMFLAQLVFGVLGVLFISGEYGTGIIHATLGAGPKRVPVLSDKLAVCLAASFMTAAVAAFASFGAGQHLLGVHGTTQSAPGALRAVFGPALHRTVVGAFSMGVGFALHNTAGGIATVFGILMVLPGIARALRRSDA